MARNSTSGGEPESVDQLVERYKKMVIAGRAELMELKDQWTVVTKDGSLCAHFEHTIAITEGKPIILTLP